MCNAGKGVAKTFAVSSYKETKIEYRAVKYWVSALIMRHFTCPAMIWTMTARFCKVGNEIVINTL